MNKENVKFYAKTSITLCLIAGICSLLIALVNYFTSPIIDLNLRSQEENALKEIYSDASFDELDLKDGSKYVIKIYEAKNKGLIYKTKGSNSYGSISLILGININYSIEKIVVLENSESYANEVNKFINETYNGENKISNLDNVDTKCGATFGAKLVQAMVDEALKDAKERI